MPRSRTKFRGRILHLSYLDGRFPILRFSILSSGSKGNSLYVESQNACILIDAGLSQRALTARLNGIGRSPENLSAVFLTHEHSDHIRGVGPFARRYRLPIYSTKGTWRSGQHVVGNIFDWKFFTQNDRMRVEDLEIETYPTPHDATESVAFVIRQGSHKLGHATDLGMITPTVVEKLKVADALLVEANHDETMLNAGPYPWSLKQRIKSDQGHLSNEACARLLSATQHEGLQTVVLMHLSETNNHPEIACLTAQQALLNDRVKIILAEQNKPTELITIQ